MRHVIERPRHAVHYQITFAQRAHAEAHVRLAPRWKQQRLDGRLEERVLAYRDRRRRHGGRRCHNGRHHDGAIWRRIGRIRSARRRGSQSVGRWRPILLRVDLGHGRALDGQYGARSAWIRRERTSQLEGRHMHLHVHRVLELHLDVDPFAEHAWRHHLLGGGGDLAREPVAAAAHLGR